MRWRLFELDGLHPKKFEVDLTKVLFDERKTDEIPDTLCLGVFPRYVWHGKNIKDLSKYVNIDFCKNNNIPIVKGLSDGGTYFVPNKALSFILVAKESSVLSSAQAFQLFLIAQLYALRKLGIASSYISNNDLMVGNKKIGGSSCLIEGDFIYLEGSINLDFNYLMANQALTERGREEKILERWVTSIKKETGKLQIEKARSLLKRAFRRRFKVQLSQAIPTDKEKKVL